MPTDTRQRMLDATALLLQRHGFHGTSLNQILEESGAPRGSLYHHFPGGKEQLALEATLRGIEEATAALTQAMRDASGPVAAVRAYVAVASDELRRSGYVLGCPVAPLVLDLNDPRSPLVEICRAALADWHRILREGLAAAGVAETRAASLAVTVVSALEGALLIARAERDTAALDAVGDELARLVEGALPG